MSPVGAVEVGVIAVLAGSLVVKVAAQRRRGIRSIVVGRRPGDALSRFEPLSVVLLLLWFGAVALHGTGWAPGLFGPRLFQSTVAEGAGALLALAALALQLTAITGMGRSWRIGIDPQGREALVTTGAFAISRNPIYLAFDAIAVAATLISGSLFFLVTAPVVMAGIHAQILREEAFLSEALGEEYARYRARVGRYLGW